LENNFIIHLRTSRALLKRLAEKDIRVDGEVKRDSGSFRMHLGFLIWHRKDRPLAGIRLNGGDWYPDGGAKQDDVTG
jgi:hypothetical protein